MLGVWRRQEQSDREPLSPGLIAPGIRQGSHRHSLLSVFEERVVRIAEQPTLTRLARRNYRVTTRFRVLAGVLVGRVVAAERLPTLLAGPKMHPACADLDAFFALPLFRKLDLVDGLDVFARCVRKHGDSPQVPREI